MKKLFFLIALISMHLATAQNSKSTTGRVGYADMEYIMQRLPDMKQIESDLKSTQTQLRNQIKTKSDALQKQYEALNASAQGLSDSVRLQEQQQLEQGLAELEKMQQDAQVTLQNKQKLYMAPLYLKVNSAIRQVAQENGFEIVLTRRVGGANLLMYQDEQQNISDLVLQKFGVSPSENAEKK